VASFQLHGYGLAEGVKRQVLPSLSRCSPTSGSHWRVVAALASGAVGDCAAEKVDLELPNPAMVDIIDRAAPAIRPVSTHLVIGLALITLGALPDITGLLLLRGPPRCQSRAAPT
jgi:hypothetical protein